MSRGDVPGVSTANFEFLFTEKIPPEGVRQAMPGQHAHSSPFLTEKPHAKPFLRPPASGACEGLVGPRSADPLSNRYNGPTPEEHGWQLPGSLVGGAKHGPVSLRTGMAARACHWSNLAACHINGHQPSTPGDPCGAVTGPWGLCASYHSMPCEPPQRHKAAWRPQATTGGAVGQHGIIRSSHGDSGVLGHSKVG